MNILKYLDDKNLMRFTKDNGFCIEFGLKKEQFIRLPVFLLSFHWKTFAYRNVFVIGRLYRGYVGALILTRFFEINVWIHNLEKEKRNVY